MKKEGVIVFLVLTLFTLLISAVNVRADIVDFLGRDQITGYGVFDAVGGLFNKLFGGEAVGGGGNNLDVHEKMILERVGGINFGVYPGDRVVIAGKEKKGSYWVFKKIAGKDVDIGFSEIRSSSEFGIDLVDVKNYDGPNPSFI